MVPMAVIAAPVALSTFALPNFGLAEPRDVNRVTESLDRSKAENEAAWVQLQTAVAEALAGARRLRTLGVRPDLDRMIVPIEAAMPKLRRYHSDAHEKFAHIRVGGVVGRIADWIWPRLRHLTKEARNFVTFTGSQIAELEGLLLQLHELRDAPLPHPDEAPVNRAFDAYRAAFSRILPQAQIAEDSLAITDIAGEILPVMTIRHAAPISGIARYQAEEDAHTEVEALDPALIGILAFDHVSPDEAA